MAAVLRGEPGGIAGLLELIEEHGQALQVDLLRLGLNLRDVGTPALTWADLLAIVKDNPEDSALTRSVNGTTPEQRMWTMDRLLLAEAVDTLRLLMWAKTEDGQKGRNRPPKIPRPGVDDRDVEAIGSKESALPADEILDWLNGDFEDIPPDDGPKAIAA